jgi:uncharacterized protein (DUF2147 family)
MTSMNRRTRRRRAVALAATALATVFAGPLANPLGAQTGDVTGVWIDHTGRGAIEITRCGTAICGNIVWLEQPNASNGRPLTDGNNPNAALKNRPICGLQVIGDARPKGNGSFVDGWIYNPEDGGRFSLDVTPLAPDRLQIHGFLGVRFLGEKHQWRRAPAGQPRCKG